MVPKLILSPIKFSKYKFDADHIKTRAIKVRWFYIWILASLKKQTNTQTTS